MSWFTVVYVSVVYVCRFYIQSLFRLVYYYVFVGPEGYDEMGISKKFGRQMVNEILKRFNIKGVVQMGDGRVRLGEHSVSPCSELHGTEVTSEALWFHTILCRLHVYFQTKR